MEVKVKVMDEKTALIGVSGRLNAVSAPELKAEIGRQVAAGRGRIIVDLTETSFIDSSGLSALISGLKLTREAGGALRLAGLNERTITVFKVTMLDRVFQIFPDAEEALRQ